MTTPRDPDAEDLLAAALAIDELAADIVTAYVNLFEEVRAYRVAAYHQGGMRGSQEVAVHAGDDRLSREVLGRLVHAGLGPLFANAGLVLAQVAPVADLVACWQARLDSGVLVTPRTVS